jgi:murein L,D-transpeptidase YafK
MRFAGLIARALVGATLAAAIAGPAGLTAAPSRESGADTAKGEPSAQIEAELGRRLAEKGMATGSPMFIRIFKAEFEFELWMRKGEGFELFATYPICYWSGTLGPKLHEGDKQAPEGFYAVGPNQIHRRGRWPRSLNIGYPNALDRAQARTGSFILVHGGCTSTGCFAMTNPVMQEIYALAEEALEKGQERIPVHVFPFRMTEANLAARARAHGEWRAFWHSLKAGYDLFEQTHLPPKVGMCNKQYVVSEGDVSGNSALPANVVFPCSESEGGGAMPLVTAETEAAAEEPVVKPRKVASKARRKSATRNARKAYAAARRARMAARESQSQIETSSIRGAEPVN